MDIYVEKQYVAQMKGGDLNAFMVLFEAYFADLYSYVLRRIGPGAEAEEIVKLTFLDALGQIQNVPEDGIYIIWLYSLSKRRVWERLKSPGAVSYCSLAVAENSLSEEALNLKQKFENMMKKLSLEEAEILRLKFFEEVTDGDVMQVVDIDEGSIGSRIYRVLKRIHFLLFGENDERQGVYFGELTGFLARVRDLESINIPEALKLNLKMDLSTRISRRDFSVEVAPEEELSQKNGNLPFEHKDAEKDQGIVGRGSNDPAKIFVEAVREMKEEEAKERIVQQKKLERQEAIFDFMDRWKHVIIAVPVALFVAVVGFVTFKLVNFDNGETEKPVIVRGYPNDCLIEVGFSGDFSDGEIRSINKGINDKICGYFDVKSLLVSKNSDGRLDVAVNVTDWFLKYKFAKKNENWRIKEYERITDRYKKFWEIPRDNGNA